MDRMVKATHVKLRLGDYYLSVMESRALSEIEDAMEDKANPDALKRAQETLTKIQHEILVRWAQAEDPKYGTMD